MTSKTGKPKWSIFSALCCGGKTSSVHNPNKKGFSPPTAKVESHPNSIMIERSAMNQLSDSSPQTQQQNNYPTINVMGGLYNSTHIRNNVYQHASEVGSSNSINDISELEQQQQQGSFNLNHNVISIKTHPTAQNAHHNRQTSMFSAGTHLNARQQVGSQQSHHQIHRRTQSYNPSYNPQLIENQQIQQDQRLDTVNSAASIHSYASAQQSYRRGSNVPEQRYFTMENEFFKLKTKFAIHEIDFVDCRPTDTTFQSYFNYDCPICYRHFNRILKSECCENYLCHFCLRDIYNKGKDQTKFEHRCMFCQVEIPSYVDVEKADAVKRYTDSPFIVTPKEGVKAEAKGIVVPFVISTANGHNIHEANLIDFQEDSGSEKENVEFKQNEIINIVNNCHGQHVLNKQPLPHLVQNQQNQGQLNENSSLRSGKRKEESNNRDKQLSHSDNENVHQSAHKPAGLIPEFQNKYHCNYLQQNKINSNGNTDIVQSRMIR